MKKLLIVAFMVPIVLVGCGQAQSKLPRGPAWAVSYMIGQPTLYYVATDKKVQTVGKLIIELTPNNANTPVEHGSGGWYSPWAAYSPVKVNAIPGVARTRALAIKFSRNAPFVRAIAQSKRPGFSSSAKGSLS